MNTKFLLFVAVLLGAGPSIQAGSPHPIIKICVTTRGMEAEASEPVRARIAEDLAGLGALAAPKSEAPTHAGGCCFTSDCLKEDADLGVAGVLDVVLLRFGPNLHITLRAFDVATAKQVIQTTASTTAKDFPQSLNLKGDLKSCLEALGQNPQKPEPPQGGTATKPAPVPEQDKTGTKPQVASGNGTSDTPSGTGATTGVTNPEPKGNSAGPAVETKEEAPAKPMHPYKLWGHVTFWSGLGLAAFGGLSAGLAKKAGDDYGAGDASARQRSRTWAGLQWFGLGSGVALMATGVVLWLLKPAEDKTSSTSAAAGPTPDGRGLALTVGGRW